MADYMTFPCDICGSSQTIEVPYCRLYTSDQPIHICRDCGFVYVRQRRSSRAVADTWSDELYGSLYTARIPAVKARQTYVADFVDVSLGLAGKSLLDIGAGEGQFLDILRDHYQAEVFGVEPSPALCRSLKQRGFPCFEGTVEEFDRSSGGRKFDLVTIIWTLENCSSCRDMLSAAHRVLKDDGHLVIATGSRILVPFKKPLQDYLEMDPDMADTSCFRFSRNTLEGIMAVSGFQMSAVNRFLDTDYLCMIGEKRPEGSRISWTKDDFIKVADFFERWHRESSFYR